MLGALHLLGAHRGLSGNLGHEGGLLAGQRQRHVRSGRRRGGGGVEARATPWPLPWSGVVVDPEMPEIMVMPFV